MNEAAPVIRLLVVDDHTLLRDGIAALTAGQADIEVVAEGGNGREAMQQVRAHRPDITIMGYRTHCARLHWSRAIPLHRPRAERAQAARFANRLRSADLGAFLVLRDEIASEARAAGLTDDRLQELSEER